MDSATKGWLLLGAIALAIGCFAGIQIIVSGTVLSILVMVGLITTWTQFPRWLKLFLTLPIVRWIVDLAVSASVPMFLVGSVTGIFAGVIVGIMITACLEVEKCRLRGEKI